MAQDSLIIYIVLFMDVFIVELWHQLCSYVSKHSKSTVMKRSYIIILIATIALISCEKQPVASFFSSEIEVFVNDDIFFTNNSLDAKYFEWDFGDGTYSNSTNPVHSWAASGVYSVALTASSNSYSDVSYQEITVLFPTTLEIEVLEYYDEYPVENASVILYPTYQDWLDETNMLVEGFTNSNGIVTFSNLESKRYYVDVWEANHDNYTLADEDVGFIETDILVEGEVNYFLAWVDYYETLKSKSTKRDRTLRMVPRGRTISDKLKK